MISVVVPFYNEIESISLLIERLESMFAQAGHEKTSYEILLINNGSTQSQAERLASICQGKSCRILHLSRNFGYQGALWAGLDHAKGDPIVFMDGDGEDPPEIIPEFLKKWREGYDVVYGQRISRQVKWLYNFYYLLFYRVLAKLSDIKIPLDAGEFCLISGQAITALRRFQDRTRMLRILRAWVGYRQTGVPYHRERRIGGQSKFGFWKAVAFAWDGFISTTNIPVRICIWCSTACLLVGILGSIYYLFWYFYASQKIPGFASLNITILILFSVLFMCISILSRYIISLLEETRKRPPYLVDQRSE
jgi:dolichol-phosphate mannosyltransferase